MILKNTQSFCKDYSFLKHFRAVCILSVSNFFLESLSIPVLVNSCFHKSAGIISLFSRVWKLELCYFDAVWGFISIRMKLLDVVSITFRFYELLFYGF